MRNGQTMVCDWIVNAAETYGNRSFNAIIDAKAREMDLDIIVIVLVLRIGLLFCSRGYWGPWSSGWRRIFAERKGSRARVGKRFCGLCTICSSLNTTISYKSVFFGGSNWRGVVAYLINFRFRASEQVDEILTQFSKNLKEYAEGH